MKKMLTFAIAVLMMGLAACTKDNTSVKQIVEVINAGYEQHQGIANGTVQIAKLANDEYFNWPDGNIFANEKIFAIIAADKDYTLTDEDKAMLTEAVEQFIIPGANLDASSQHMMANHAKDTIRGAKKLKDLYAHGSTL